MKKALVPVQNLVSPVLVLAIFLSLALTIGATGQPAYAAGTINVTTTADENGTGAGCSLREAIISANTNANFGGCTGSGGGTPFTINIPAGTFTLSGTEIQVGTTSGTAITLSGAGSASSIVTQTGGAARIFELDPNLAGNVSVSMSGLTLANGAAQTFGGGAILGGATGDALNLDNMIITNNTCSGSNSGAGISWSPAGNVTITNSTFSNNVCGAGTAGAVLYTTSSGSSLTISNSTFNSNSAGATGSAGGALLLGANITAPTFTINGSNFTNNHATNASGIGGAIYVGGGTLNLGNTAANRFLGNTAGVSTSSGLGVRGGTANANNNWWGCNGGPGSGPGCDKADNSGGVLSFTPWVVLSNAASPSTIQVNQTSTLTADFLHNSSGGALTTSQIGVLIGRPVSWGGVNGAVSNQQTSIQSNGTATATFTASAAGAGSASATVDNGTGTANITVNKGDTTSSLFTDTPDPSVTGQDVTVTFGVASNNGNSPTAPTGNVTVSDGTNSCTGTLAAGQCTLTITSTGAKSLTATYAGDSNFNGSTSSALAHTVNQADTTTTITSDNPDPSTTGQAVTVNYSVGVVAPGAGTPTGNVTVSDGVNSCTGTIAAGTCDITLTTSGSRTLTATYAGDSNFNGSSSAGTPHTVNGGSTTTITSDNPDPSVVGQSVTVQYSVTASGGTPTGNVTVSDGTVSCTGTVAAGQCSLTFTSAGAKSLTAIYAGDGTYQGSTSAAEAHLVNPADTTTTITSDSPDPSSGIQPVTVNYSVTVNAPGAGTPTGNVTVSDGINSCTGTLAAGQCSITLTTNGVRTLTAIYTGDSNFNSSTSAGVAHTVDSIAPTVTINQAAGQPDPTSSSPILFTVVFSEPVSGFTSADIFFGGSTTSGTLSAVVSGGPSTYTVSVTGMTSNGNVVASILANAAADQVGNPSLASTSTDNMVTFVLDSTPPDTSITAYPTNPSQSTSASFTFSGTDNITPAASLTFQCKLDSNAFAACTSPQSYSNLSLGSHNFQVRAFDAVGNVDLTPASYTWSIQAATSLLYNGGQIVNIGSTFQPAAKLSSTALACTNNQPISFSLDRNPLTGVAGTYALGTINTSSGQATLAPVNTTGWLEGIYTITAKFAGTLSCTSSQDDATLTVASPGDSANGGGWYTLSGSGRINFGFTVRKTDATCQTNCAYKGQLLLINNGKWRLKATLNTYSKLSTGQGASSGTGDLYWWNSSLNGGLGDWALAQSGVSFTINFYDSGSTGKSSTDTFGIRIVYTPVAPQPSVLPNSTPQLLKGGNIQVK